MQSMDLDFNKNEDNMKQALEPASNRFQKIAVGGGIKAIEKQHEKNKLTARERIQLSAWTPNTDFLKSGHLPDMKCMKNMVAVRLAELLRELDMSADDNVLFSPMIRL